MLHSEWYFGFFHFVRSSASYEEAEKCKRFKENDQQYDHHEVETDFILIQNKFKNITIQCIPFIQLI